MEEALRGGYRSAPVRRGDTVVRPVGPWSPGVHRLLGALAERGFTAAPRVLATDGSTETLTFVPGAAGTYPVSAVQRSEQALASVARTLRVLHDVTSDLALAGEWQARTVLPVDVDCFGHNDLGPYNVVFDGSEVVAFIDWDLAGPSNRVWDLCYAAHRFAPLSAPRSTVAFGWDPVPDQGERLRTFLHAYGLPVDVGHLLDLLVVRLAALAANVELQVSRGNPAYDRQRDEHHGDGYREDVAWILGHRTEWVGTCGPTP